MSSWVPPLSLCVAGGLITVATAIYLSGYVAPPIVFLGVRGVRQVRFSDQIVGRCQCFCRLGQVRVHIRGQMAGVGVTGTSGSGRQ